MIEKNEVVSFSGNIFTYILASIQINEVFQIIELVIAILTSLVLLGYRIWKWWKEAKKDGKIDKREIKEGISIIADTSKEISKSVKEHKEKEAEKDNEKV